MMPLKNGWVIFVIETYLNMLQPEETIKQKFSMIVEGFVSYYGEEERSFIEEKLKSVLLVPYQTPEDLDVLLIKIKKTVSNDLIDSFFTELGIENTDENKKKYFNSTTFDFPSLIKLNQYLNFYEKYQVGAQERYSGQRNQCLEIFKKYGVLIDEEKFESLRKHPQLEVILKSLPTYLQNTIKNTLKIPFYDPEYETLKEKAVVFLNQFHDGVTTQNIESLQKQGVFNDHIKEITLYKKLLERFNQYVQLLSSYEQIVEQEKTRKNNIEKELMLQLITQLKDNLDPKELEKIMKMPNESRITAYQFPKICAVVGFSVSANSDIEAFSQENDNKLKSGRDYQKDSIKYSRIRYFRAFGIDLGDDYDKYQSDSNCRAIWPTQELVERIVSLKSKFKKMEKASYYSGIPNYLQNRKRIDELGLINKDDGLDIDAYENKGTHVCPNLRQVGTDYILHPILFINLYIMPEYMDVSLIHELNHVIELHLQGVDSNGYTCLCGYDIVYSELVNDSGENNNSDEEEEKRSYELFNEIINELIAQEITTSMHENGLYIFNTESSAKIRGGTNYEKFKFLVHDFFMTYKKEIIASRRNGNISIIFDKIGKENFESLNQLFHIFNANFGNALDYYRLLSSLKESKETAQTKLYHELNRKKDEILNSMREYSLNNSSKSI